MNPFSPERPNIEPSTTAADTAEVSKSVAQNEELASSAEMVTMQQQLQAIIEKDRMRIQSLEQRVEDLQMHKQISEQLMQQLEIKEQLTELILAQRGQKQVPEYEELVPLSPHRSPIRLGKAQKSQEVPNTSGLSNKRKNYNFRSKEQQVPLAVQLMLSPATEQRKEISNRKSIGLANNIQPFLGKSNVESASKMLGGRIYETILSGAEMPHRDKSYNTESIESNGEYMLKTKYRSNNEKLYNTDATSSEKVFQNAIEHIIPKTRLFAEELPLSDLFDNSESNFNHLMTNRGQVISKSTVGGICKSCHSDANSTGLVPELASIEESKLDESAIVELGEDDTPESLATAICEAKRRKDRQELRILRAKERKILLREVARLRACKDPSKDHSKENNNKSEFGIEDQNYKSKKKLKTSLQKKCQAFQQASLSPSKTMSQLTISSMKPDQHLKIPDLILSNTTTDNNKPQTPKRRMYGFTREAYQVVKKNQQISLIVNKANLSLYNLRNSVQLYYIDERLLRQVPQPNPEKELSHMSLMGLDMGDDAIEVIKLEDFFSQVMSDLNLQTMLKTAKEFLKLEHFFAQIGALAVSKTKAKDGAVEETKYLRFDIVRSAWQVHGYEFSNLRRMKRIGGLNFNMLSVKSIRIMNRFSLKILGYQEIYTRKVAASSNVDIGKQNQVSVIFAVLLAIFNDFVEARLDKASSPTQVVRADRLYDKLVDLKVRRKAYDVPNLTTFLAYKNESNYIDIKNLATATGEFLRNQYLKSFGTSKKKLNTLECLTKIRQSSQKSPLKRAKRHVTICQKDEKFLPNAEKQ